VQGDSLGLAADRQVFTQVHAVAQIRDAHVALANGRKISGGQQPARQGIFAHGGAGRAQELVQAAGAEQIQVGAIQMMWILVARAGRALAPPLVANPREPGPIKQDRPLCTRPLIPDAQVMNHCRGKCQGGNPQP
jgi:hypothetical protein